MRRLLCLALVLGLAVFGAAGSAGATEYLETFEPDGDPAAMMAGTLLIGSDGAWSGALADGTYRLSNAGKKGGIKYFHLGRPNQGAGAEKLTVGVDVLARFEGTAAGAGLVYLVDPRSRTYYAFVVGKGSGYSVFRRGNEGFKKLASGTNDAIKSQGVNRLSVELTRDKARLYVNEAQVIGHSVKRTAEGNAGIIAVDLGDYRFDNFWFATE